MVADPTTPRKKARRGAGEGSVYQEPHTGRDGRVYLYWVATTEAGRDPVTGRRRRIKVKAKTKAEALRKRDTALEKLDSGVATGGRKWTVGDWLDHWLDSVVAGRVGSELTVANYRSVVDKHLKPALGGVRLDRLTPEMVDRFLAHKASDGRLDLLDGAARDRLAASGGPLGLGRSYVNRMRVIMIDALTHAERRGLVMRNVAQLSVMPRTTPPAERRSLTEDELRGFLAAARGERLEALFVLGAALGLRPGELTGLLWSDLNLDSVQPILRVSGSMKRRTDGSVVRGDVKRSTAGRRTIQLPEPVVRALKTHKARQATERLAAGEAWSEPDLVFATEIGTAIDPSNLRKLFARVAQKAGLSDSFPYLLRHTAVSVMLHRGGQIEVVADLVGDHPRTLHRFYRHRVSPVVTVAADLMGDVLEPAQQVMEEDQSPGSQRGSQQSG